MDMFTIEKLSQMGEMMQSLSSEAFQMQTMILEETKNRLPENSKERYLLEMFLKYLQEE